ncbi:MAG: guanylate kinase [Deltaproteobacteria bacterium]|nr:guanylate kinase [Deltaproteobacteria bacterium]
MQGKHGLLFVLSSPSGAGKTTLCRRLLDEFPEQLCFSVSTTTRPKRPNERDGVDYYFVDEPTFTRKVEAGDFAEWAEVHGNRYGTAWATIHENVDAGRDVIFDIDYQGAQGLHAKFASDTAMVFVLPPSLEELAKRLRGRGTDASDVVERRLNKAKEELQHYGEYQYLVLNDDLDQAYAEVRAIYVAAHCVKHRRSRLAQALIEESRLGS